MTKTGRDRETDTEKKSCVKTEKGLMFKERQQDRKKCR